MTQRQRHASGGVSDLPRRPATPVTTRPGAAPAPEAPRLPPWDEYYPTLPSEQQAELLALASQQGVLSVRQLPPPPPAAGGEPAKQLLARLFDGGRAELPPLRVDPLPPLDEALDRVQRDAVARALATPDLLVVQGLPGTGKSRVVAEMIRQAAARGERVLLLAPMASALDRVLELLGEADTLLPVRCLGRDEKPEALSPTIRSLTFAERLRRFGEEPLQTARRHLAELEDVQRRRRQDLEIADQLESLVGQFERFDSEAASLRSQRDVIPSAVAAIAEAVEAGASPVDAGDFGADLDLVLKTRREAHARLDSEQHELLRLSDERRREEAEVCSRCDPLRPLAEAKQHGRWWTGQWWQATFQGDIVGELAKLETERQQLRTVLADVDGHTERLRAARAEVDATYNAEKNRRLDAEVARRQAELDQLNARHRDAETALQARWDTLLGKLDPGQPTPTSTTVTAVRAMRPPRQHELAEAEGEAQRVRETITTLTGLVPSLPGRLGEYANVVAATMMALSSDEHFGTAQAGKQAFDLLVIDGAERVSESEFLAASKRARRWIMVGEAPADSGQHDGPNDQRRGRGGPRKASVSATPAGVRLTFFDRLWQHLHCDLWVREQERLCCRLRPLPAEHRQWLECEAVADFPDIELRILTLPRCRPELAEVAFPPGMSLRDAKAYIYRELQELPHPCLPKTPDWCEVGERVVLRFVDSATSPAEFEHLERLVLGEGVGEVLQPAEGGSTKTAALSFDRSAGWDRNRAEEWATAHLGAADPGRTARLDTPYRARPALASFISAVVLDGAYRVPQTADGATTAVEFIPVPPAEAAQRLRESRGGAGLELDLADGRHRDRLPADVAASLPAQGLVNYLEAKAVVQTLEALAADQKLSAGTAVLALYPAQAELIRQLVAQSPTLAGAALTITVPAGVRQREFSTVLVSLTRSHSHRAVTFGDDLDSLPLAMTRARDRLLLVGDPGTLARRAQWDGPVDQFDDASAARERALIGRLTHALQGPGSAARATRAREGNAS